MVKKIYHIQISNGYRSTITARSLAIAKLKSEQILRENIGDCCLICPDGTLYQKWKFCHLNNHWWSSWIKQPAKNEVTEC